MLLKTQNLSISHSPKLNLLNALNLNIEEGEVVVIIGENGVGKSTLIKTLSGLLDYHKGSIKLENKELKEWHGLDLAQNLAYVASNENVSGMLTVSEFVAFGRYPFSNWLMKLSEKDKTLISESLSACGITYLCNKKIDEISDGEKQKVFLAKALAQNTKILIFDEPTSHLDIKSSRAVLKLINTLKSKGKSIVFSSHQVEKALAIADKIWLVDCGRVIQVSPKEFENSVELKRIVFGED